MVSLTNEVGKQFTVRHKSFLTETQQLHQLLPVLKGIINYTGGTGYVASGEV